MTNRATPLQPSGIPPPTPGYYRDGPPPLDAATAIPPPAARPRDPRQVPIPAWAFLIAASALRLYGLDDGAYASRLRTPLLTSARRCAVIALRAARFGGGRLSYREISTAIGRDHSSTAECLVRVGMSKPGTLEAARAVAASVAFPGVTFVWEPIG